MWWSLLIGIVVVVFASGTMGWSLLKEQREPAMVPVNPARARPRPSQEHGSIGRSGSLRRGKKPATTRVSIWVRARGLIGLVALCASIGATFAIAIGYLILRLGFSLN